MKIHQVNHLTSGKKIRVEINDDSRGPYNANKQIKFTTSMLMSKLVDYGDAYMLVGGTITILEGQVMQQ